MSLLNISSSLAALRSSKYDKSGFKMSLLVIESDFKLFWYDLNF